jgi:hypothetical protein
VDGRTFWGIETHGAAEWLAGIREELREDLSATTSATGYGSKACGRGTTARDTDSDLIKHLFLIALTMSPDLWVT